MSLTDALGIGIGVTDNAGARSLVPMSFDALARLCNSMLHHAHRCCDYRSAAALLQASSCFFRRNVVGRSSMVASGRHRRSLTIDVSPTYTKSHLTSVLAGHPLWESLEFWSFYFLEALHLLRSARRAKRAQLLAVKRRAQRYERRPALCCTVLAFTRVCTCDDVMHRSQRNRLLRFASHAQLSTASSNTPGGGSLRRVVAAGNEAMKSTARSVLGSPHDDSPDDEPDLEADVVDLVRGSRCCACACGGYTAPLTKRCDGQLSCLIHPSLMLGLPPARLATFVRRVCARYDVSERQAVVRCAFHAK